MTPVPGEALGSTSGAAAPEPASGGEPYSTPPRPLLAAYVVVPANVAV